LKNENDVNKHYVLDTSAYFTLFEDEEGSDTVQNILEQAKVGDAIVFTSFVSFTEVFYITFREEDENSAVNRINLMSKLEIERVESSKELGLIAGRLKANNRISFADSWIAATAKSYGATLVHKDPEFDQLKEEIKLLHLPYKK
jgi:predicted nucleic acid-binding protein